MINVIVKAISILGLVIIIPLQTMAGEVKYVPISSDITFFVPVFKPYCNSQDVCISWINQIITVTSSGFTDDSGFNYSLDSNKRHQMGTLYYNSPTFSTIKLQCLDGSGSWVDINSSTGDSVMSVINSTDGFGQPLNLNYSALEYPVYQHRWPGNLLTKATNCQATTVELYAPVTTAYTYKHTQKSLNLRMLNPDGSVAYVMPSTGDSCRVNSGAPNLWDRTLSCVGSSRPTSIQLAVDETITRESNYGTVSAQFGYNQDQFSCNWYVFIDDVPQNVVGGIQQVYGRNGGDLPQTNILKGAHTIKFDRNGLLCYTTSRNCAAYPSSCVHDTIYVKGSGSTTKTDQTNSPTKIFQIEVK